MQLLLPIFPDETKMITESLGVFKLDGLVYYLHCGVPIYIHSEEDIQSFRYITTKFIVAKLCKKSEIQKCFGVSYDSINRDVNKVNEQEGSGFFSKEGRHGSPYKLVAPVMEKIQKGLNEGKSNCQLAREANVSEGSIRYAINTGKLKKKPAGTINNSNKPD